MAKIYATYDGTLLGFCPKYNQQAEFAFHFPAATTVLELDETTNGALVDDIKANWSHYTLPVVNSVPTLEKDGEAVAVAAASGLYVARENILGGVPLATIEAYMQALWNGTATNAQAQKAIAYLLLKSIEF